MSGVLLSVRDLSVHFRVAGPGLFGRRQTLRAVDGVSFDLHEGETLGVVGESGCGKSTLARAILRLVPVTAGRVTFMGQDLLTLDRRRLRAARRDLQIVFQDPLASLDPRMTVGEIVAEPLEAFAPGSTRAERRRRVAEMLERVGLSAAHLDRYPHQFSGGQCQRIGIARALVSGPKLVVCDEPVSALDVSIQAQIVNLLMDLQAALDLTLLFIAHDLAVVRHISHRIMVLYLGRVVELGGSDVLCRAPCHPYTEALMAAVPVPDPRLERTRGTSPLSGELPSPLAPPSGCAFRSRCPIAGARCASERPPLLEVAGRRVACHEKT